MQGEASPNECLGFGEEVRTHTALHIVKGAAVRVLGEQALWTASTYVKGRHGRITVTCERKPTEEEVKRIEELANEAVQKNLKIEVVELPRREAEEKYGKVIYDLFPVPEHVQLLKIVIVRDADGSIWNINACNREHLPSTKCIGRVKIDDWRFRASKKLLEISFDIEP